MFKKLTICLLVLLFVGSAFGAIKPKSCWRRYNRGNFTLVYAGSATERAIVPDGVWTIREGDLWYDTEANLLNAYNGSSWVAAAGAGSVDTLDAAYGAGSTIDVDTSALTFTTSDNDDNVVMALVQNEATNDNAALTITLGTGATGSALTIDSQASGTDITGDNWSVNQAGGITAVAGTWTGDQLFTGNAANIEVDVSQDSIHFLDNALLSIGGATTAAGDFVFSYDGTDFNLEAAAANDMFRFGETTQFDFVIHGATNTNEITFDTDDSALLCTFDGFDLQMNDSDIIQLGDSSDVTIAYDGSNNDLDITSTTALDEISFGATGDGYDIVWHGTTAGDYVLFDYSADKLILEDIFLSMGDAELIEFGDSDDVTLSFDGTNFEFLALAADTPFHLGATAAGFDITYYFETAGTIDIDYDGDNIAISDDMTLNFGTNDDVTLKYDETTDDNFEIAAGSVGMSITTNDFITTLDGAAANQFKVDATGTVAGNAIVLETTDGGVQINADGVDNGDITLDSADDLILTSAGAVTVTNTEAVTVSGDVDVGGVITTDGVNMSVIVPPDGAAYDVLAANTGIPHMIIGQTSDITMDLPAEAAGLNFKFVYVGGAEDAQDWIIDSENNTNFFIGGLATIDDDDGDVVIIYSDGSNDSNVTILTPNAGTVVEIWCDGTNWYISGAVYSGTETAVVFANL